MIYALCIIYNSNINERLINLESKISKLIIFDNSTNEFNIKNNALFCLYHDITYIAFNKNLGLSFAYEYVSKNYLKDDDYLLLLDSDTNITLEYINKVYEDIINNHYLTYIPISIDEKTSIIHSPMIKNDKHKFKMWKKRDKVSTYDYFSGINNGLVILNKLFKEINYFDNSHLFVYFTDLYLFRRFYEFRVKTKVINYINKCDFSFTCNDKNLLIRRLKFLKKDAKNYYSYLYRKRNFLLNFILKSIHYFYFKIMKSIECSKNTSYKYFFNYLFA